MISLASASPSSSGVMWLVSRQRLPLLIVGPRWTSVLAGDDLTDVVQGVVVADEVVDGAIGVSHDLPVQAGVVGEKKHLAPYVSVTLVSISSSL